LITAGLVPAEEVEAALCASVVRGIPFLRALIDRGALTEDQAEDEFERLDEPSLLEVAGMPLLMARLPSAMCRRFAALPVRIDPDSGAVDVAAADPFDAHVAAEFAFHLHAPVRVVRARLSAIEAEVRRIEAERQEPIRIEPPRWRRMTPPSPHGAPQSTDGPMPQEDEGETPIPLVRRVSSRDEGVASDSSFTSAESLSIDADEDIVLPLRNAKPPHRSSLIYEAATSSSVTPPLGTALGSRLDATAEPSAPGPRRSNTLRLLTLADITPTPAPTVEERSEPRADKADKADSAPRPARAPDANAIFTALELATTRDELVRLSLRGMRIIARRFAIFAVRRDGFYGWACNVEFGDPDALREIMLPIGEPSILATAIATRIYVGPVPTTAAHEHLLRVMETSSTEVAAIAVRASGRPAMVLIADEISDPARGIRFLEELARAVGDAFVRLLAPKG